MNKYQIHSIITQHFLYLIITFSVISRKQKLFKCRIVIIELALLEVRKVSFSMFT